MRKLLGPAAGLAIAVCVGLTGRWLLIDDFRPLTARAPAPGALPAGPPADLSPHKVRTDFILQITYVRGFTGETVKRLVVVSSPDGRLPQVERRPGQECPTEVIGVESGTGEIFEESIEQFRLIVQPRFEGGSDSSYCSIERIDRSSQILNCPEDELVDSLLFKVRHIAITAGKRKGPIK